MQIDVNKMLAAIGAEGEGDFKVYPANSRIHVFVKAKKLPTEPTMALSFDLPGNSEELLAQGINYLINTLRNLQGNLKGNESQPTA
jgi:hypothetical protein